MILPRTLKVETEGNELKGIIYQLKTKYKIKNPIDKYIVLPTSNGGRNGDISTLVLWNSNGYGTTKVSGTYVQLTFPQSIIHPTAYSFKGPVSSSTMWWCYTKAWNIYGIREGDEDKDVNSWDLLGSNNTQETPYCHTPNSGGWCNDASIGTYHLNVASNKMYKHIRWIMTEGCSPSSCNPSGFGLGGIDVYGTLINKMKICSCRCNYQARSSKYILILAMSTSTSH